MTLWTVFGGVGGLLASVIAVSAGWAQYKTTSKTSASDVWRENAEAEKVRGDRLEVLVKELSDRVARLEAENKHLSELVTGSTAINELRGLLVAQHTEILGALRGVNGGNA